MVRFTEALEVDDLPGPEEADDVVDVGVVGLTEDIVVSHACLLLCCNGRNTTSKPPVNGHRQRRSVSSDGNKIDKGVHHIPGEPFRPGEGGENVGNGAVCFFL